MYVKGRYVIALVLFVLGYILIGGTIPYIKNPEIEEEFKQQFSAENFYGKTQGVDRAKVIIDNGEALAERIRLIEQVEERIVISTFSFASDTSGKQMRN